MCCLRPAYCSDCFPPLDTKIPINPVIHYIWKRCILARFRSLPAGTLPGVFFQHQVYLSEKPDQVSQSRCRTWQKDKKTKNKTENKLFASEMLPVWSCVKSTVEFVSWDFRSFEKDSPLETEPSPSGNITQGTAWLPSILYTTPVRSSTVYRWPLNATSSDSSIPAEELTHVSTKTIFRCNYKSQLLHWVHVPRPFSARWLSRVTVSASHSTSSLSPEAETVRWPLFM